MDCYQKLNALHATVQDIVEPFPLWSTSIRTQPIQMPYKDPAIRKAKHQEYSKRWYEANKKLVAKRGKVRKKEYRKKWLEYKSSKACSKCGIAHPAVLDFHHVIRFEKQSIPQLVNSRQYSRAIREAEEKCIPLCANCHRMLHWHESRKRKWL